MRGDGATLRERDIVRHQNQRRCVCVIQIEQQIADDAARSLIEIAGRLVRKKNARTMHERTRQRDALLFAARQLMRIVAAARVESDVVQRSSREVTRIGTAVEFERKHHVFLGRQRGQQMKRLKQETDVTATQRSAFFLIERIDARIRHHDFALRWRIKSREQS